MADLRRAGHEVYVVGGTVRDIMLQGTPKDLDILTTATPRQIKKLFRRCLIVGRRFPVAHVRMGDVLLEVSSFDTSATPDLTPLDAAAMLSKLQNGSNSFGKHAPLSVARRHNALARDFTVNALLYDPFSRVLYDYVDGVKDLQRRMLRCIGDPRKSFQQDPARMLRAIRLAARADLKLDEGAAAAIRELGPLTLALPSGRLQMELTSMMAHGAAARSIQLLWQFDLLDLMLPVHAAYLRDQKHPRQVKRARTDPLFQMLEQMDRHIQPHHPGPAALAVRSLQQRDGKSRGPSQDSTTTDEDEAPPDRGNLTWEQRRGLERRRKPKRNDNILQAVLQACNRAALSAV
ncbi:hypothetical protein WJX72_004041 [[Myrmecia] bisecta]|uniref:Poly(A) polymerase n=1 Tax=[Myrmecia] bisecta TaxID=41462 RepID=A0AAW1P409_9CHLO